MWHYSIDGAPQAPIKQMVVAQLLTTGRINAGTLVWREGMTDWLPLAQTELATLLPAGSYAPPPPPGMAPGFYGGGPGAPLGAPTTTSGAAVTSLVLGILGLLSCGLTALPAVIFGHVGSGAIRRSQGSLAGGGMATAGLVMGYLGLIMLVLTIGALPLYTKIMADVKMKQALRGGMLIQQSLVVYATEHEGRFPKDLAEAVLTGDLDEQLLVSPRTMPFDFWEYRGAGHTLDDAGDTVLLTSKQQGRLRVVIRLGGTGKIMTETEWEAQVPQIPWDQ